jgi:hypothetical protein
MSEYAISKSHVFGLALQLVSQLMTYVSAVLDINDSMCCFIFAIVSSSPSRKRIYNDINVRGVDMKRCMTAYNILPSSCAEQHWLRQTGLYCLPNSLFPDTFPIPFSWSPIPT